MGDKRIVLTDAPEEPALAEAAKQADEMLNIRIGVTPDGLVGIVFDQKVDQITVPAEVAMNLAKQIVQCAAKAEHVQSRIVVPDMAVPPIKPT